MTTKPLGRPRKVVDVYRAPAPTPEKLALAWIKLVHPEIWAELQGLVTGISKL